MRADIHGGPEHDTLQYEAGYIDARPTSNRSTKTSCDARPDHTLTLDLVKDAPELICVIRRTLGNVKPRAADSLREAFDCAVIIIHHCGIDGTRPRGHTSLTGAADAQLSVSRDAAGSIVVTVEYMKDGAAGIPSSAVLKL